MAYDQNAHGEVPPGQPAILFVLAAFRVAHGAGVDRGPAGEDGSGQAAAGREFAADDTPLRANGFDNVAEDFVHSVFVEDAQIAVGEEIHF